MPPMEDTTPASISSSVRESAGNPAVRAIRASAVAFLLITMISSEISGLGLGSGSGKGSGIGLGLEVGLGLGLGLLLAGSTAALEKGEGSTCLRRRPVRLRLLLKGIWRSRLGLVSGFWLGI